MMDEKLLIEQLRNEGFDNIYVWQDGPEVFHPDHQHDVTTAHIILDGEMELVIRGKKQTLKKGMRFDVISGTTHAARMGPNGCKYVIGEKSGWTKVEKL